MATLLLLLGIALLISAIYLHAVAEANVITKIERQWFERLFTGSRSSKDNFTEEGLRYRNRSNLYALLGFLAVAIYLVIGL